MARHCIRDPRYIPPVHVIGEQPDLFGGPTISHEAERKPVGAKALRAITKWAVAPWLGDADRETVLEKAPAPLPVYLVSCVAAKVDHAAEARDLYISPWFRKARAYVERTGSPWLILSAKHGLIAPGAIIEPYDATLSAMGAPARRLWGARVLDELARVVDVAAPLIVLAGRSYRDPLWPSIAPRATAPMEGLAIGEQLAWLSRRPDADAGVSSSAFPDTLANGEAMTVEILADPQVKAAIDRLVDIARSDTGQSARVANFLLAWWNGDDWGHFPIADLFGVDRPIAADMATIFAFLGQYPGAIYVHAFGEHYRDAMADLVEKWRET